MKRGMLARFRRLAEDDPDKADRLLTAMEYDPTSTYLSSPEDVAKAARPYLMGRDTEALLVIAVNRRHRVVGIEVLTTGTESVTIVSPAQVLRWVFTRKKACAAFVMVHNHPSGDPTLSPEDIRVSRAVADAAKAVGLLMLDHLVVTNDQHSSYAERHGGGFNAPVRLMTADR